MSWGLARFSSRAARRSICVISDRRKEHEVLGKYTDNKPGLTRIKTPGDTPGRDISKTLDQNQSGGSAALTKPPSWNK
ncbi:MAG: hypothetical protein WCF83_23890, partial [Pseudolabrys sp.]